MPNKFPISFIYILSLLFLFFYKSFAQTPLVKSYQKISNLFGDFQDSLTTDEGFGYALTSLGDINGDGVTDICVGAPMNDDGGLDKGAIWILYLNSDGSVKSQQKISELEGNFTGTLDIEDYFGRSIASIGDLNADGFTDLAVGTNKDDDGGTDRGAIWILFMKSDGTVKSHQKISSLYGNFSGTLDDEDLFGSSVANIGDINKDGVTDIAVGANFDDDGGTSRGAVWILFLNTNGTVKSYQKISDTEGNFNGTFADGENFGISVCGLGDLNQDEFNDIAVGSHDNVSAYTEGAVWILFLDKTGMVSSYQKIAEGQGNFSGTLESQDYFGISLSNLSDINADGNTDIAVGALFDDDGGNDRGACWILYLNTEGKLAAYQKISSSEGGFSASLADEDYFGRSVTALGDMNADGSPDLCIGASHDDDLNSNSGALWNIFLDNAGISSDIIERNENLSLAVYPNPFTDYLIIKAPTNSKPITVKLFDSIGKTLTEYNFTHYIQLKLDSLSSGIYFLALSSENERCFQKIIKK